MIRAVLVASLSVSACLAEPIAAQADPHASGRSWVFFTDKGLPSARERSEALAALEATYPTRAVERRRLRRSAPGLFDERDLPVHAPYTEALAAAGARVHAGSRWLNAVSIQPGADLDAIRALPFVRGVAPVRAAPRAPASIAAPAPGPHARSFYGLANDQLAQINLPALHARGYTGTGVVIGILDTGFSRVHQAFNHADNPLPVVAEWDFIDNDPDTSFQDGDHPDQHVHGTLILGAIRAYEPDDLVGGAFDASVILCKTEDVTGETPIEEDNYVAALEFIELHGGDMATSSLSYSDWYTQEDMDGRTAVTTIAVNTATDNGVHCCTAAGNSGHDDDPRTSHLGAPADAFEVITCGAVSSEGSITGFSSDGPTADGRVKPELLAQGADTWTISPFDDSGYTTASGTSLSTPLVASAVACLIQARPWWTPQTMRDHLFATASDFVQFGEPDPRFVRGYGILDAAAALDHDCAADINGDGAADTLDVLAFLNEWNLHGPRADFNGDGAVNTVDVLAFLNAWAAGC